MHTKTIIQLTSIMTIIIIINANQIFLTDTPNKSEKLHMFEGCIINCLNDVLNTCYKACLDNVYMQSNDSLAIQKFENIEINLKCRDNTQLILDIYLNELSYFTNNETILIARAENKQTNVVNLYISLESPIVLNSLNEDTVYTVTVDVIGTHFKFLNVSNKFSTLKSNYVPETINIIEIEQYRVAEDNLLDAQVLWQPANDQTCFYELIYYPISNDEQFDVSPIEIYEIEDLYNYTLKSLDFDMEYGVAVRGLNVNDRSLEGSLFWIEITTPPCYDFHSNNLSLCPPSPPTIIATTETFISNNIYDIKIMVEKPLITPVYYTVKIFDLDLNSKSPLSYVSNFTGNLTEFLFQLIELNGLHYEIHVTAFGIKIGSTSSLMVEINHEIHSYQNSERNIIISIIIATIVVVLILATIPFIYCHYSKKLPKTSQSLESVYNSNPIVIDLSEFYNDSDLEIPRENVQLLEILGEGAFGVVKKAVLLNSEGVKTMQVAVKMLKDDHSIADLKEFVKEIDVMKGVDFHPNIVGIIGHCCRDTKNVMLITEFCKHGNLLNYLYSEWLKLSELSYKPVYKQENHSSLLIPHKKDDNIFNFESVSIGKSLKVMTITSDNGTDTSVPKTQFTNLVINRMYDEFNSLPSTALSPNFKSNKKNDCITYTDLLSFTLQISQGMEFLSKNKIVHRDLAARNVLVCDDKIVKISDFGMSRDIYQENIYKKMGTGKVPIKWLALESMERQEYTSQSDVWSFGILLYEIVTMGASPYPGFDGDSVTLFHSLKDGYRMEMPDNCNAIVYELMRSCWNIDPNKRPTFTDICEKLDSKNWDDMKFELCGSYRLFMK